MQRKNVLVLALAATILVGYAAWAQAASPLTGRVTSVNTLTNTITVDGPSGSVTFKTDSQTMVMRSGQSAKLNDLKEGDEVTVTFTGDGDNRVASHVHAVVLDNPDRNSGDTYRKNDADTYDTNRRDADLRDSDVRDSGMGTREVTGRVVALDRMGRSITLDTPTGSKTYKLEVSAIILARNGATRINDIHVGDEVRLEIDADNPKKVDRVEYISGDGGQVADNNVAEDRHLPRTASRMPLIGITGLLLVGVALVLGIARRSLV